MKFTDGNWLLRAGVTAHWATEAYEVEAGESEVRILVPTQPIRSRGDTLRGPVLTVALSSPMPDVVRVRISHFEGTCDREPNFELSPPEGHATVQLDGSCTTLTSGRLSARVSRKPWGIDFLTEDGFLTRSSDRSIALMEVANTGAFLHEQLALSVGENVYGLGERFTAFVKNGQVVDIWNRDGGTNSEQAYKNIPFYLSSRGYGVFVNHPGAVSFEVASERSSRVGFSVPGEALEYFVIYGPEPKEVLRKYTHLTGRPALPPAWSFGLWLSTSFTTDYDEETVTSFVDEMARRDLPLHVFHFDCFWMRAYHWTDLVWDPDVFPDPPGMIARLKKRGLRISAWINPYIAQASRLFKEGRDNGYLVRKVNGDVWQSDQWQPGMALVDFTNPGARQWFAARLAEVVETGVDALKTDFGERIPTDVTYHDGSDPERMHNYYTQLYNQTVFHMLESKRGKGEAVLFARSATVGGQQYPVHWGGDCWSDFDAMAESLRGGLSLGMSGFGFWSHDIGGFEGHPPAELYKRWAAFGLLSSHSRLHGSSSYRVPWAYDEEACEVVRFFTKLKCRLMPYLYAKAVEAHEQGVPVMRAMLLEFPNDPASLWLDRQYMLGEALLVAPVFSTEGEVEYYVPPGRWTSLITGEEIIGPGWRKESHGAISLPLLVRPNTVLPTGSNELRPDYDFEEGVTFEVFALEPGRVASATVYSQQGERVGDVRVSRQDDRVTAEVSGAIRGWSLLFTNEDLQEGGVTTPRGARFAPPDGVSRVDLQLRPRTSP